MSQDVLHVVIFGLVLFLVFLPSIIAEATSRVPLVFAALLLSLLSVAAFIASILLLGFGITIAIPVAGSLWTAGLLCGLAAWMNAQQERRHRDAILRLLMNDSRGLGTIDDIKRGN